jgi:hypothetical protein
MRPLTALLGIVLGSAVAIFVGLAMTFVVYMLLPEFRDRLSGEFAPLLRAIAWTAVVSAAAAAAFVSELRQHRARRALLVVLVAVVGLFGWTYWP